MMFSFVSGTVPALLLLALLVIFVRDRLYLRFRFFFLCTVYSVAQTVATLSVMRLPVTFFLVYWTTQVLYGTLALLAILEVFLPTLEWYLGRTWSRLAPTFTFLGLIAISLWRAFYRPVGRGVFFAAFAAGAYAYWLGVFCIEALVFFTCVRLTFRKPHRLRWGRYRLGILTGFALQACASAVALLTSLNLGPRFEAVFHYASPAAYIGATVIWLFAFAGEDTLPVGKKTDMETFRRAVEYVDRASDEAERDVGMKLRRRPKRLHSLRAQASAARR